MNFNTLLAVYLFPIFLQCVQSAALQPNLQSDVCYANNVNPYLNFGTKTAYEHVYERQKNQEKIAPGCTPVQIWLLARHGTRYPAEKELFVKVQNLTKLKMQITENHDIKHAGKLCSADVENLKRWTFNVPEADAAKLTEQGERDLYFLAKRVKAKFPQIFRHDYNPNVYYFKATSKQRTRESAQKFAEGIFGPSAPQIPYGIESDPVIKPYPSCTTWQREVNKNPLLQNEADLFKKTPRVTNIVHNVSQRLGFKDDLPVETIMAIHGMCSFDKAWTVKDTSPWCAAFTRPELEDLEYIEDLETYYDSGYGNELNLKLGCPPLKDMLERFTQLESGNGSSDKHEQREHDKDTQPAGVFYFTHRHVVLMAIARLGIAGKGIPLRHDNYDEQQNREWRSSLLGPFTANLMTVFFKCDEGESNKVMFFVNEKKVDYEGCDSGLCSWAYIKNKFADIPLHCNLDWCNSPLAGQTAQAVSTGLRLQILLTPLMFFTLLQRLL